MIYDQTSNASFFKKIESVHYDAELAITGTIKGSSHEKLYQKLGLEYYYRRSWARRLCLLYKVFSTGRPSYIQKQPPRGVPRKRCSKNIQQIYWRTPIPKCDFNKVALQSNFIEIAHQHGYSPVI